MKIRNKKTGEIGNLVLNINPNRESYSVLSTENSDTVCGNLVIADYDSLAELNAEWEDYNEPDKFWFIQAEGAVDYFHVDDDSAFDKGCKSIGNYFETKEEAEKAVEKLKAWKRLRDKGFVWQGWEEGAMNNGMCVIGCQIPENNWETDVVEDLDLLFGGEE